MLILANSIFASSHSQISLRLLQAHSMSLPCRIAISELTNKETKAIDQGQYTIGIFLDLSEAFDTTNHKILIKKLQHYGIRGKTQQWFLNYLTNRKQIVKYNQTTIVCKNVLENIFSLTPCLLSPPPISNVDYLDSTTLCNTKITIFNIDMGEGGKNSSHITEKLRKNAFSKNVCTGLSRFEK